MEIRPTCISLRRAAGIALALFLSLCGSAVQAAAQTLSYNTPAASSYCVGCHGSPFGKTRPPPFPQLPEAQAMRDFWETPQPTISTQDFRDFLQTHGAMLTYASKASINDANLATILPYFMQIRNASVQLNGAPASPATMQSLEHSFTFASAYSDPANPPTETLTIKITNLRQYSLSFNVLGGGGTFPTTTTCNTLAGAVYATDTQLTAQSCEIAVKFVPPTVAGSPSATLNINLTFASGSPEDTPLTVQHHVSLSGTSLGPLPAPGYSPSAGFDNLTFSAFPTTSQTLCPTVTNSGTAPLIFNFAIVSNVGNPEYFELNNGSCPAAAPAYAACVSPLAAGATCALAVTFNPSKVTHAGGSPTATLRVTHNASSGPTKDYTLTGTVTPPVPPTSPAIGLQTTPLADPVSHKVSPLAFKSQTVGTTSAVWNDFLVFNSGTADGLLLSAVTHTNTSDFTLIENCATTPALPKTSGTSPHCAVSLSFKPAAAIESCTSVTVHSNVGDSPAVLVCGTGVNATPAEPLKAIIDSPAPNNSVVVGATLNINGAHSTPSNAVTYQWTVGNPAGDTMQAGTAATQLVTFGTVGTYRITLVVRPSAGGAASAPASVDISVSASGSAPVFAPSGFDALANFSASTAGSQTRCPTIKNNGTDPLSLSFSTVPSAGSSTDASNYFELGDNASCPSSPRACSTSAASGPIAGSTELRVPADSVCTLALRFNPAKFGDAGGLGAKSTTLRIMHNAPAGTVFDTPLIGTVTMRTQPRIGIYTDPSQDPLSGRVLPPAFAAQTLNTSSTLWNAFQVSNTGDADGLDLTEVINGNTQDFSLTENCVDAPPLARAGSGTEASCVIGLRFTPKALGQRCTTVTIRAAASSNGAQSATICGTGVAAPAPALTLSTDSIDFGRRYISAAYLPKELVISNGAGATASLQINAVTLVGAGFALVPNAGAAQAPCVGTSLAAGTSCTLKVQFDPDPARPETPYSASLQIDTNDTAAPKRTVSLTAVAGPVATPQVLQFVSAPAQMEFTGIVVAGQQSAQPLTVTLRNTGPGRAKIDATRMVGADASSFSAGVCPKTLEQDETCVISVVFVPGSGGLKRAQLEIVSATSVTPAPLTVIGRAVGGTSAFLTASVANLALGNVRVGAQSAPIEVRLASAGDGVVQVTGLQAGGPFTVRTKTCPGVPFTLPRGADCTVTVTFTPTDASAANAMLRISTDADIKAVEVPLTASGEASPNLSSGGCSMVSGDTLADPTLAALVLLAICALAYRRRARAARRGQP